jgi:hypothetical protein
MAHLTPPSSKQNTPVRRTDPTEAPVSPTSTSTLNPFRSSGSATLALASPPRQSGDVIDEEEGLDLQAGDAALGGAANEMDIDEEGESESESEDEIDVEDLEEVEGDEGLGPAPEQAQSIEGAKTEDIVEDAKAQTEEVPAGGALAPAALLAKAGGKKKKVSDESSFLLSSGRWWMS